MRICAPERGLGLVLAALLAFFGGTGCRQKHASPVEDAGQPPSQHTDLRAAMTLVFPDFRSATVTHVQSGMLRQLRLTADAPLPWRGQVELFALGRGFTPPPPDAGTSLAVHPPFVLYADENAGVLRLELRLPMTTDSLSALLQNPTTLSSQAFVALLPVPTFAKPIGPPLFYFEVHYVETSVTGDLLLQRLLSGLEETGFQKEQAALGNAGPLPEQLTANWIRLYSGSHIHIQKNGREVHLRYEQRLPES